MTIQPIPCKESGNRANCLPLPLRGTKARSLALALGPNEMNSAPQISRRQLLLLRLVAATAIIFIANEALIALSTGHIQATGTRIKFSLGGEQLWAGYLFLSASAGIFVLLLFINHAKSRAFNTIAKALGITWLVSLSLTAWLSNAT